MILAVMVGVLCYRVYQVVNPVENPDEVIQIPRPPGQELPPDVDIPEAPPRVPLNHRDLGQNPDFKNRNPFQYSRQGAQSDSGAELETSEVRVLRVLDQAGTVKAQIESPGTTEWYEEGEQFEAYTLVSINPETKCCEIYFENLRRTEEKCPERR